MRHVKSVKIICGGWICDMDKRTLIRRIINYVIFLSVTGSWIYMAFFAEERGLSSRGIASLKFYTVLSNFLAAISSAVYLMTDKRPQLRGKAEIFKFMGLVTVSLTFAVVLLFLGPLFTYRFVYSGAGLFMHLIVPILCAVEYLFLAEQHLSYRSIYLPLAFTFLYGAIYLANVMINGPGSYPDANDFYSFTHWGLGVGILIFAVICVLIVLISFIFLKAHSKIQKKR